eukprot:4393470-Amphidinium_carterae.1
MAALVGNGPGGSRPNTLLTCELWCFESLKGGPVTSLGRVVGAGPRSQEEVHRPTGAPHQLL